MDEVKLGTVEHTENHVLIVMLAYLLLCTFSAFAEAKNFGEQPQSKHRKKPSPLPGRHRKPLHRIIFPAIKCCAFRHS